MSLPPADQLHVSVLLDESMDFLQPKPGGIYVDGNLGLGGHSEEILARGGTVIGFDWDEEALAKAEQRLAAWSGKIIFVRRNFAEIKEVLDELDIPLVDGILLDLGLSSLQLDLSERGFSFQGCQPLDMRMDTRLRENAADLLNKADEEDLADILYFFGEERQARPIAAAIVEARKKSAIATTEELVAVVKRAVPSRFYPKKIHVATRTFQALRIAVNHELDNLVTVLSDGPRLLKPGGRMAVISFHSLEDRLVKKKFRDDGLLQVITRKPVKASAAESSRNPRSRSACLRVAQRLNGEK